MSCLFECVVCIGELFLRVVHILHICCSSPFSLRSYGTTDGVSRVDELGTKVENVSFLCIWMACTYLISFDLTSYLTWASL